MIREVVEVTVGELSDVLSQDDEVTKQVKDLKHITTEMEAYIAKNGQRLDGDDMEAGRALCEQIFGPTHLRKS